MDRNPTYEELEKRVRELEGLLEAAGVICHEMNQPMQAILGNCELLMMDMDENSPYNGRMIKIRDQIDRMKDLTSKLMNLEPSPD